MSEDERMLTWKRTRRTALFAFVLLLLMLFPYGPLFPWSPVKPGFEHVALGRADVYYPSGAPLDPAYLKLDEYLAESERFHQMKAPARLCVVACGDWASFGRFLPQHRSSRGVGAVTLVTGTVISLYFAGQANANATKATDAAKREKE